MTEKIKIHALAGFCHERALWKMLIDLSSDMSVNPPNGRKVLMPDTVVVDGEDFCIDNDERYVCATEFFPPEGCEKLVEPVYVWSLGALICYASSGHYIFGGRGGKYQHSHPQIELPTLRKEHSALDPLVKRCLCYNPSQRISLKELHALAIKGLGSNCEKKRIKIEPETNVTQIIPDDTWPEKME